MIHSYDTDVAIALGGIAEAVVLKEVAYWCKKNEGSGKDDRKFDGRFWTFAIPIREWQAKFPEIKNIGRVFDALCKGEWLISGIHNRSDYDRTKSYTLSDKSISLIAQMDLHDSPNGFAESSQPIPSGDTSDKQTPTEKILKEFAAEIDRLYSLYPGQTETREGKRSTGKCSKDKQRIAGLLKTHTVEQIERSITKYLEETGGRYLKNFSTFLNNLPEYEEDTAPTPTREDRARALGYQTWNE